MAIVGLTILVRAVLVPLTYRQLKSMQEMQRLAPQINALKEKYKDDKQRQQQELMKFYQENKINPLASCLPLLLQLPVFVSLFYMLRTDLKKHICGTQLVEWFNTAPGRSGEIPRRPARDAPFAHLPTKFVESTPCEKVAPGSAKFLFIPDITNKATGIALVVLIVALRRLAARLDADRDRDRRPQPAPADAAAAGGLRGDPLPLPGGAAGVLDHHQPVDDRPAVPDQTPSGAGRETRQPAAAGEREREGRTRRAAAAAQAGARRGSRCDRAPRVARPGSASSSAPPPPRPPRKKKKRSGRRR